MRINREEHSASKAADTRTHAEISNSPFPCSFPVFIAETNDYCCLEPTRPKANSNFSTVSKAPISIAKACPRILFSADRSINYFTKLRLKHRVDVFNRRSKKRLHIIEVSEDIQSAKCWLARVGRQSVDAVCITLQDNRSLVYNAKSGRRLATIIDPSKDTAFQAGLDKKLERAKCFVRYVVVLAINKKCNLFYDFSNGSWEGSSIPDGCLFRDREVAEAVASVLTEQERKRQLRREGVACEWNEKKLQIVAVCETPARWKFLEKIPGRNEAYIPSLPRPGRGYGPPTIYPS